MKEFTYFIGDLDNDDRKVFIEMLPYVSPFINSTKINGDDIVICFDNIEEEIVSKLDYLKSTLNSSELNRKYEIKPETVADFTQVELLNTRNVYEQLLNEHIFYITEGVYAYSGLFLSIFSYFCKKIDNFAHEAFTDIKQFDMPVLSPISNYEKGKYFESFPHHIMFQTNLINDIEVLDMFAKQGTKDQKIFLKMEKPKNVLRHAGCVPIYPYLENQQIGLQAPKCFLVSGKCFRNEGKNAFELARLNEFYMKEYVFVGSPEQCISSIEKSKDLWRYWIDTFGLNCKIETANDSFFASNYNKLKLFQMLGDSKQELKVLLPSTNTYTAVSSLNIHRTHFTKVYNIKSDCGYCHSACFAFGIERLSYALISQKGTDISKWDNKTLDELKNYIDL